MKHRIVLLSTSLCLWMALPLCGQPASSELRLSVTPEKREFVLGEPVTLLISLQNLSAAGVTLSSLLDPKYEHLTVWIKPMHRETFLRLRGSGWGRFHPNVPELVLAGGDSVHTSARILLNRVQPADPEGLRTAMPFSRGRHEVRVELADRRLPSSLVSSPAELEIVDPSPIEEAFASAITSDLALARLIESSDALPGSEPVRRLAELAAAYPEARHASYAWLALGQNYLRVPDRHAANQYLELATRARSGSVVRGEAMLGLAMSYLVDSRMEEAESLVRATASEYAGTGLRTEINLMTDRIARGKPRAR